jgi:catechol 2,3-dioxygenase-like lactoylglutathione lyase family enzyme
VPLTRLNHAVLYVSDVARSVEFYTSVMGFEPVSMLPDGFHGAAFLKAIGSTNDHDLGLFEVGASARPSLAGRGEVGLYHLAWEVDTLTELQATAERLAAAGALVGASDHGTTKSLYAKDPDGLEFEVVWLIPAALIEPADLEARQAIRPLDLRREIERFGAQTRGGVGISVPA